MIFTILLSGGEVILYILGIIFLSPLKQKSIIYKYINIFLIAKIIVRIISILYSLAISLLHEFGLQSDFLILLGYLNAPIIILMSILGGIPYLILLIGIYKARRSSL
ncbi:hypothetical protein [Vallitalea okinawensis]|uniref:hypothetical protein n=1 Tax=Vallitalea okinawensis TaxID=2078660 RepID=UPI000CFC22E0|nr:hypothetical protein [Vallitalea okinawensis]